MLSNNLHKLFKADNPFLIILCFLFLTSALTPLPFFLHIYLSLHTFFNLFSIFVFLLSILSIPPSSRRVSLSWPFGGISWGPTLHSSPRNIQTPARMQPEPPIHPLVGMTWTAQKKEGGRPTVTGALMAQVVTSVRTSRILK